MKITQLRLAGMGSWPELAVDTIGPELNVFYGSNGTGKTTTAQLAAHLLYGKAEFAARLSVGRPAVLVEGSIEVASPEGKYLLRRHRDGSPQGRLSIASAGGPTVDGRTIRTLLAHISPRLLATLYAVDFASPQRAETLLSGEFAQNFTTALSGETPEAEVSACNLHKLVTAPVVDRHRLNEFVRRRDEAARQIEQHMSAARRMSGEIERELKDLDAALSARRRQVEPLEAKLRAAEAKLAEIAATLRYFSLESAVRRGAAIDGDEQCEAIERLDAEIARCRQMLSDMQLRDATVRRELAEVHPDGTADSASSLADQRATVGVLERLLNDLDAEVSQLARSHEPGRCVGCDSHARLSPVAQMLRQQLYTLCGQVTEQERTARRMQLHAEARQLARAQTDLSEQLEHLLGRRQSLVHEAQLAQRPVIMLPQPPAATHCQCHGHAEFVKDADAMLLARSDRSKREHVAHERRRELERDCNELRAACDSLHQEIEMLQARWQRLQRERATAAGSASLEALRQELSRAEANVQRALHGAAGALAASTTAAPHRRAWKASDVLAQLTDGELKQIRLHRDEGAATIINREGRALAITELSAAQQDQLYLALTLSLASSFSARGIDLPLILDEPFIRQDARSAAAMAGVLAEFARQGRQVILFTANRDAAARFESLGVAVQDIDLLRRRLPTAATPQPLVVTPAAESAGPEIRVVRETIGEPKPKLRVTGQWAAGDEHEVYYLATNASIADFPVLGNDTAKIFAGLEIHTVEQLLAAHPQTVALQLARPGVTANTVRLWQAHMSLMCFVPGMSLNDAQVLAANEVGSPAALYLIDVKLLAADLEKFIGTQRGRRFAGIKARFTCERLAELQSRARTQSERWEAASLKFAWLERPTSVKEPVTLRAKPRAAARREQRAPLRFLLDTTSPVEQAPSIDAATAELLANVGVRTVADLLNANPNSTADEIGEARITAAVVSRWQHEARLACRIPELRCSGAQILVAAGLTQPEQVAGANVAELHKQVRELCRSPHGKRLLRDGKPPSRERVAQWVRHAAHTRPLEAA